ncbi:MAG: hypothetical protein JSV26_10670 [bacterium]|nr:MAG: hypothetical protein JSV26_10670 [bacterium]
MRNSLAALTLALAAVTMVATTGPARAGYGSGAGVISVGEPDHLVYIFDKGIYFVPNIDADIFYHLGRWYQRSAGRWYESPSHGGPWAELPLSGVPKPLIEIPMDFREAYDRYGRVPYRFVVRGKFRYYGGYGPGPYAYPYTYPGYYYVYPGFGYGVYPYTGRRHYLFWDGYHWDLRHEPHRGRRR